MICKKCGKNLATTDKVCANCGAEIEKDVSPTTKGTPQLIIPDMDAIDDFTFSKLDLYQKELEEKEKKEDILEETIEHLELDICDNCSTTISDGQSFCPNCGNNLKEEMIPKMSSSVSLKKKKPLFWVFLFGGEVLLFLVIPIVVFVMMFVSQSSSIKGTNVKTFKNVMADHEYVVEKVDVDIYPGIKSYYVASKNGYMIQFVQAKSVDYASKYFENLKNEGAFKYDLSPGSVQFFNVYESFSSSSQDKYYSIVRVKDTILYSVYSDKYEEEVQSVFTELGYQSFDLSMLVVVLLVVILMVCVLNILVMWKLFEKAGQKGWYALIPYYNVYVLTKMVYEKGSYCLFLIVPCLFMNLGVVSAIISPILSFLVIFLASIVIDLYVIVFSYKFPKVFGKDNVFCILNIFFAFVIVQILAFDHSLYYPNKRSKKLL